MTTTSKTPTILLGALLLSLFNLCYTDLPIHCLQHQVVGQWKLEISEPQITKDPYKMNCGHEFPDNPANSYLAMRGSFKPSSHFMVNLDSSSKVKAEEGSEGTWTMIYDEGFDISFDGHRFTSFFEYSPDVTGKVMSYCGRTVVGWYKNLYNGKKACFKAEKQLKSNSEQLELYGEPLVQMHVVQPVMDTLSFLQMSFSARKAKVLRSLAAPELHKGFSDHRRVVDKLNQLPEKLWHAHPHSKFAGMTIAELNKFAGRKKLRGVSGQRPTLQKSSFIQVSDVSNLPKEFSWEKYLSPMREQGNCGSCYVFATLSMIEARLRIKHQKEVTLSPQHVLDCSFHNQGCDGGYPFLVEKFASEFELVPENCSPYLGAKGSCKKCDPAKLDEVYRVENYRFVGGAYGKSNEKDMMLELMHNGPIVASFEPPYDFMFYQGGIYHGVEPDWVRSGQNRPEWERVDHSVLLYGWGETASGQKYWKLLNSWGTEWGENGSFRMMRGADECAIESLAEAADPVVVKNSRDFMY